MRHGAIRTAFLVAVVATSATAAAAEMRTHLIVIGNNQPWPRAEHGPSDPAASVLRFADDDAAAFYQLMIGIADDGHLLTSMDRDTQVLYPRLTAVARLPTMAAVRRAVASVAASIEQDHHAGRRSALFLFYSGHGSTGEAGLGPALALQDGGISQSVFYDEILARLPADYVHVLVDACHAEAVVRPRDLDAGEVTIAPAEADALLARSTLARFPNVGAILAASSSAQAHEWDLVRQGVFTHELLSALRGAGDVNRDGLIEYSEVYAFLTAANRGVSDARAHLHVVARAPDADRRVPLVDLARFPAATSARLTGVSARAGLVKIEDGAGRSIASVRTEPGFVATVVVPAGGTAYVRSDAREARFEIRPGQTVAFDDLAFDAPSTRARGALADAMSRGLFATAFGPSYYMGCIDQAPEFIPVGLAEEPAATIAGRVPSTAFQAPASEVAAGASRTLVVGFGVARPVARNFAFSESLRLGVRPRGGRGAWASLDLARGAGGGSEEWQGMASVGWLRARRFGPVRGWLGVAAGGGIVAQVSAGADTRRSGAIVAGPAGGLSVQLPHRFGLWFEAQLFGMVYRRDDRSAIAAAPGAWMGASLDL
jgi:hypothetical protein